PETGEIVSVEVVLIIVFECGGYVWIWKPVIEEWRQRIEHPKGVLHHPRQHHGGRTDGDRQNGAEPPALPSNECQGVGYGDPAGVLHAIGESRHQPDREEQTGGPVLV